MTTKSGKVPKGWEGLLAALTGLTDRFCDEHLGREYADLARYAIAALCRKRLSPLTSGHQQTWACVVLYALGQINFLHDKSTTPYMAMADLCGNFGIVPSTGGNKAKLVRKPPSMHQFDHNWTLPSRLASRLLPWLIEVDGLVVDARQLPVAIQAAAVKKGLRPFVYPPPDRRRLNQHKGQLAAIEPLEKDTVAVTFTHRANGPRDAATLAKGVDVTQDRPQRLAAFAPTLLPAGDHDDFYVPTGDRLRQC
jgi:hypothetical protein